MTIDQRKQCEGLDDASIMETMEWLKDQCILLHFELQRASSMVIGNDKGRDSASLPCGGSEQ
jgi:hypothetical protein